MAKIIKAINQVSAQAKASELGITLPAITIDSWPQIKNNLGEFGARLEREFTIEVWSAMRGRGDTQYVFLGQYDSAQPVITASRIAPPPSGCSRCGRK